MGMMTIMKSSLLTKRFSLFKFLLVLIVLLILFFLSMPLLNRLLLPYRADLYTAIRSGNPDIVRRRIEAGLNPNGPPDGTAPITMILRSWTYWKPRGEATREELRMIRENTYELVQILVENGAEVNVQDSDGNSALHYSLYMWHMADYEANADDTILRILENGADVNLQNNKGETPLALALYRMDRVLVEMFLKYGGKIKNPDGCKDTILHRIISNTTRPEVRVEGFRRSSKRLGLGRFEYVLEKGVDPNLKNADGVTALEFAIQKGREDMAEVIRQYQAQPKKTKSAD